MRTSFPGHYGRNAPPSDDGSPYQRHRAENLRCRQCPDGKMVCRPDARNGQAGCGGDEHHTVCQRRCAYRTLSDGQCSVSGGSGQRLRHDYRSCADQDDVSVRHGASFGTGEEILTNPANDYVREFVEEVDRSKVLTAQNIMVPALTTNIESDGPNVALTRMRNEEVSMLMAVDRKRHLKGIITADQALEARKQKRPLIDFLDENVTVIGKDMVVSDIFNIIYDSPTPLAVVEDGKLKGVVIRGSVIEALAETSEVSEHE